MSRQLFSSSARRLVARSAVAVATAAGLIVGVAPTAHAANTDLVCSGGGTVAITKSPDGTYDWLMSGVGQCSQARIAQVRQVSLVGRATTQGLGFCSDAAVIPD